jgi:L-rhamnose mutarotase
LSAPENLLFAYWEYHGEDWAADAKKMAADKRTQDWWAIRDPMQEPLASRKAGEWWAGSRRSVFTTTLGGCLAKARPGDRAGHSTIRLFVSRPPSWMRKGGRSDSDNEPMRFNRSILGSSDRRM